MLSFMGGLCLCLEQRCVAVLPVPFAFPCQSVCAYRQPYLAVSVQRRVGSVACINAGTVPQKMLM